VTIGLQFKTLFYLTVHVLFHQSSFTSDVQHLTFPVLIRCPLVRYQEVRPRLDALHWYRASVSTAAAADCVPVSEMTQRRHLRSAAGHQLVVPSYRLNSCGLRAFSVLGLRLWNSLHRLLRDTGHITTFGLSLKTFFLSEY